jgi:SAM-dependent methyltransferase
MTAQPDAYGRLDYRSLIAWPERLQREAPLFQRVLARAPSPQVLDLGCGSGEHTRFLTSLGFSVTGVDASPAQLAAARESDLQGNYVLADLSALSGRLDAGQGGALCVGNTLPHLCEEVEVRAFFTGLATCLLPGAPFLLQLLNYDRILDRGERSFPVHVRPGEGEGEDLVFLRLMTHQGKGRLSFLPATLRYRSGAEPPLEILSAQEVALQGWRRAEVETLLCASGFRVMEVLGTMTGDPWTPMSSDLVVVAQRS